MRYLFNDSNFEFATRGLEERFLEQTFGLLQGLQAKNVVTINDKSYSLSCKRFGGIR